MIPTLPNQEPNIPLGPDSRFLSNLHVGTFYKDKNLTRFFLLGLGFGLILVGVLYFRGIPKTKLIRPLADLNAPNTTTSDEKMIENPLTGELVAESAAKTWVNERPLGVMINNHVDARPQSGLIDADIVYEIVAEGGITRFLAFFLSATPEKIGPVRSVRHYYLVLVKELRDAMIMHIGWSPQALEAIETWPVRSLARGGASFWRDNPNDVAIEHTAYVNGKDLRDLGLKLGWEGKPDQFKSWKFSSGQAPQTPFKAQKPITIDFWYQGDYSAIWEYSGADDVYLRFEGYDQQGKPLAHLDRETKKQISAKTLIVQFADETSIVGDEKNRLDYLLTGTGNGLVFSGGEVTEVTWTKPSRDERTLFYTKAGTEVEFKRGKFWISIVPSRNASQVKY